MRNTILPVLFFLLLLPVKLWARDNKGEEYPLSLQLFAAIQAADSLAVDTLLAKSKVPVTATYYSQISALGYAALRGDTVILKLLLKHGAALNSLCAPGGKQITPLGCAIIAGRTQAIAFLLRQHAQISVPVPNNFSGAQGNYNALIQAALANNTAALKLLLKHGAAIDSLSTGAESFTATGKSALMIACENNFTGLAQLLIESGANVQLVGKGFFPTVPLVSAATGGDTTLVKMLLQKGVSANAALPSGFTPLLAAAGKSNLAVVKILMDNGAMVNVVDANGNNALITSVLQREKLNGVLSGIAADIDSRLQFEGMLFQEKMAWKQKDSVEDAGNYGLPVIEEELLAAFYVPAKQTGNWNEIVTGYLQKFEKDNLELTAFLISRGIAIGHKNKAGQTAASLLHKYKMYDALQLLVEAGFSDPGLPAGFMLRLALQRGNNSLLANSLQTYATVLTADELHQALLQAVIIQNAPAVSLLLQKGAGIHRVDETGKTALHYAAFSGDSAILSLLLKQGARKGAADTSGVQPWHIARFTAGNRIDSLLRSDSLTLPGQWKIAQGNAWLELKRLEYTNYLQYIQAGSRNENYYLEAIGSTVTENDPVLCWLNLSSEHELRPAYIQAMLLQNMLVINPAGTSTSAFRANQNHSSFKPFEFAGTISHKLGSNGAETIQNVKPTLYKKREDKDSKHDAATSCIVQLVGMKQENDIRFPDNYTVFSAGFAVACGGWKNNCELSVGGKCIRFKKAEARTARAGYTIKGVYHIPKVTLLDGKYNVAFPGVRIANYPKCVDIIVEQNDSVKYIKENESIEVDRQMGDITVTVAFEDEVRQSGSRCQDRVKESFFTLTYQPAGAMLKDDTNEGASFEERFRMYKKIHTIREYQRTAADTLSPVQNYSLFTMVHLLSEQAKSRFMNVIRAELVGMVDFFANTDFRQLNNALIQLAEIQQLDMPAVVQQIDAALEAAAGDSLLVMRLTELKQQVTALPVASVKARLLEYKKKYQETLNARIQRYNVLLLEYSLYIAPDKLSAQLTLERIPVYKNLLTVQAKERFQ